VADTLVASSASVETPERFRTAANRRDSWLRTEAEFERATKNLRVKLMQMMAGTLRAADCAAKACSSGHIEIAVYGAREYDGVDCLLESILAQCQGLRKMKQISEERLALIELIETISLSLSFVCRHAHDASLRVVTLLRAGAPKELRDMAPLGECITCSLRLCLVAFANRKIAHAIGAVRRIDDCRWMCARRQETQAVTESGRAGMRSEQSIATNMARMMESAYVVALQLNCATIYNI